MKQQLGSTVLGFIIGLVTGLAIALAVAVYVTKVPVPFLQTPPSRTADQDADETRKNKDWDPNAPLYGKNPARPASAAASAAAGSPPPATPLAAAASAPKLTAPGPAPAGNRPVAAPETPVTPAKGGAGATTSDPFTYQVQAGAFRTPEDAEAQRVKLSLSGVEARVSEREQSGRSVYRVRVGPLETKEEADKVKERLDSAGFETTLIRVPR